MKVLLLTQDINGKGGVGNYFRILKSRLTNTEYLINGSRLDEAGIFVSLRRFLADYLNFLKRISDFDLVHINTSMRIKSLVRDSIFIALTKMHRKKAVIFVHGWDHKMARLTEKYLLWLYRFFFFRADVFIVLASEFKLTLQKWGYDKEIYLLTTLVDDQLIRNFGESQIRRRVENKTHFTILFLARVEKGKGIFQTLDIFKLLLEDIPNARLLVAGDGSELKNAKSFVAENNMPNVHFLGFVREDERRRIFQDSDLYLFPTHYGEGMPTTILEAMAFGLPVVTRPVGGIKDFFITGQMGHLLQSDNPQEAADTIASLARNPGERCRIGLFNHRYICENMVASKVQSKLESIYDRVVVPKPDQVIQL